MTQDLKTLALVYHQNKTPGKIGISPTKPLVTQEDLALAYSPGVAEPVKEIHKNVENIYKYTARGNMVAVISNGTAILGLGNLGAAASKPVMEGKAVLFKRFADVDAIDLEVDTTNPDEFISAIKHLGYSFGGINLEDIKAPECFYIEDALRKALDIPVFHDDQHGTAIIVLAGLINAALIAGKELKNLKIVVNGAGAAAIACLDLLTAFEVNKDNVVLCDTLGVVHKGRKNRMNQWKERYATELGLRSLEEAIKGADVFLGLSVKGALSTDMVKKMAPKPIIFALANPDPEITPDQVRSVRNDAIVATGRSDYPNQVNNLMGFPYIFRGALDVRAREINTEMKIAAALTLAKMAREIVPTQVSKAMKGKKMVFGPEYIIPSPFDPRLIIDLPIAVAKAAIETGVAGKKDLDFAKYRRDLASRLNPSANYLNTVLSKIPKNKRIILADGEDIETIKAAFKIRDRLGCTPVIIGRTKIVQPLLNEVSKDNISGIELTNAVLSKDTEQYVLFLYEKLQRLGYTKQDCANLVKNDKNIFAACMLAFGGADSLIMGNTRDYDKCFSLLSKIVGTSSNIPIFEYYNILDSDNTLMVVDPSPTWSEASSSELAQIILKSAKIMRNLGLVPSVALVSYQNFADCKYNARTKEVLSILDSMKVDFEYDGNMTPDVALNPSLMKLYPFCKLSSPANILIMPNSEVAAISLKMLSQLLGTKTHVMGPILSGFKKNIQLHHFTASEIFDMAVISLME